MKQNTTVEQFLQLPYKQSLRLLEIMGCKQVNPSEEFYNYNKATVGERFVGVIDKINIGKMFEILELKTNYSQHLVNEGGRYCIIMNQRLENPKGWETEYHNEICDALWEAVIHVI